VGTFLVTKGYFSDIIFIDSDTDMMLGASLIFVGIIDYFVVPVFLKRGLKK
jgi:response regulator of citrate/malate metabolism